MLRHLVLLFFFSIILLRPHGQQNRPHPVYSQQFQKAETLYNSDQATPVTDSLALHNYNAVIKILEGTQENDTTLFTSYVHSAILLTAKAEDDRSIEYLHKAIELNHRSLVLADSLSFLPWLFAGSNYYSLNNFDSALACYRQAEAILQVHPGLQEAERLYNKMGILYYESGDFRNSIPQFTHALDLLDPSNPAYPYFAVNYKNNIASAYRKLQEYDKAIRIYKSLLPFNLYTDELRHNIGITYLDVGSYDSAIHYLKSVTYRNASIYNDLAKSYIRTGDQTAANNYLQLAFKTYSANTLQDRPDHANSLRNLGELYLLENNPAKAIQSFHLSILEIYPPFTDSTIEHNPAKFSGMYNFYFLFDALAMKANAFNVHYQQTHQQHSLENAFATYESAVLLAQHMESLYRTDESRVFLKRNAEKVYQSAVETGVQLHHLSGEPALTAKLFKIIEDSKASILQADLYRLKIESMKGMPTALLTSERKQKALISGLQLQLAQSKNPTARETLEQEIQEASLQLSRVQQKLDENSTYNKLRFNGRTTELSFIQKNVLDKDELILSYYLTGTQLITFYISEGHAGFIASSADGLYKDVTELRNELVAADGGSNELFHQLSRQLYNRLLQPVASQLAGTKRLIIIPHNQLSFIPFEMLQGEDGSLVIDNFSVGYQYSANFLGDVAGPVTSYKVLSMAPFANAGISSRGLARLAGSLDEVQDLPGKVFLDNRATKAEFLRSAEEFPIIQLSTHAQADDSIPENSYIVFRSADTEDRLYVPDIYKLNLSGTRLALLSACRTGTGQLVNSEGVISLSRAFSYSGCPSVITSFWKADDKATSFITRKIHTYLRQGFAADEALRHAKLDYLHNDDIEARFKKPSYWANLVLIGNHSAVIQPPMQKTRVIVVGLIAGLLIVGFITWRKKIFPGNKNSRLV